MSVDDVPLLNDWRQGDFILEPIELPILALDQGEIAVTFVNAEHGVAIISQSCDLIRDVELKPFVHVAALERANEVELERTRTLGSPGLVYLPNLAPLRLVVNLDTVAAVQKELVATWDRQPGCASDDEQRSLAAALARHRQRFAFPDEFNKAVKPFRKWVQGKRSADSADGRLVRALRETRVSVDSWEAPKTLLFTLIMHEPAPAADEKAWETILSKLEGKFSHEGYPPAEFRLVTYDDISARELLESDRLDLDGLSDA